MTIFLSNILLNADPKIFDLIIEYIKYCFDEEDFNVFKQLIIPCLGGFTGGFASFKIMQIDEEYKTDINLHWKKYYFLGALAGWLAVNLLNPSGTIAQVLVLSFIAGLSGLTYIKRNALVEDSEEKKLFLKKQKNVASILDAIIEDESSPKDVSSELKKEAISEILDQLEQNENKEEVTVDIDKLESTFAELFNKNEDLLKQLEKLRNK